MSSASLILTAVKLVAAVVTLDNGAASTKPRFVASSPQNCRRTRFPKRFAAIPTAEVPLLASGKADVQELKRLFDALTPSTELVRLHSAHDEVKPMVIDPDRRLSYRELDVTTRDLAVAFIEAGVGKGTRVGLIMPNGVRWVQIAIALTRIGAVLVPLSTLLPARELVAQLRTASVQFLISVEEFRGHRYLDDLRSVLGVTDLSATLQCPGLPALRQVWAADRLPDVSAASRTALSSTRWPRR